MDNWLLFALERYNYWIVITLMMTGLYIVFARGNLVKKIVGLNIFQTSVFIYYITIGKIAGGTAPIYMGGELEAAAAGHGEGEHGGGEHGAEGALHDTPEGADAANDLQAASQSDAAHTDTTSLHAKVENTFATNDMKSVREMLEADPQPANEAATSLHAAPHGEMAGKISNEALAHVDKKPSSPGFEIAGDAHGVDLHGADAANSLGDVLGAATHGGAVEAIIYSNPLPHVLILTAIVVGVATTAVGLALAVRIREAYATIEEDELETMDNVAEFGEIAEQRAMGIGAA